MARLPCRTSAAAPPRWSVLAGSTICASRSQRASGSPTSLLASCRSPPPTSSPRPSEIAVIHNPAVAGSQAGASAPGAAGGAGPDELARRLGEILRLREWAYARRDASVLDTIYTADCACLRSGQAAIARLLADHAVWRGRSVLVRVERLSRVDDSLWIALAVLRRSAFRIEGEDGMLRSAEPAASQRYRFALVRTGTGAWLLGHASLVEELPP